MLKEIREVHEALQGLESQIRTLSFKVQNIDDDYDSIKGVVQDLRNLESAISNKEHSEIIRGYAMNSRLALEAFLERH